MRPSELMTLLFNSTLPTDGYDFSQHSLAERETVLRQLFARTDTMATSRPMLTLLEIESEQTIYLITDPGHFAHPSIIRRSLFMNEGFRTIRITGFTAAQEEVMATWLDQFRQQDKLLRQAVTN